MKFSLYSRGSKRPLFGSASYLGYLTIFVALTVLVSGCSTKVDTENSTGTTPSVVPNNGGQYLPPNIFQQPLNGGGTNYSPQTDLNTPYYPPGTTYPQYPTSLNCYLQRSGGYYYMGYPVQWDFYADNNEPLQVVRLDSGEVWQTPPSYPLPSSFAITFYTAGQRQLSFTVRSARNPSLYCNGGTPIYDSVHINSYYSYY